MTLCISFRHYNRKTYDQAFALSDSRITVVRSKQTEKAVSYVPSNLEITHQNDLGIKLHVIKSDRQKGRRDIVASVAGAVPLGIQSVIYLEAMLSGMFGRLSFSDIIKMIDESVNRFWENAYDKDIEYLFMLADDSGRTRILEKVATGNQIQGLEEIPDRDGIHFGIIGDKKIEIREIINGEINGLLICAPLMPTELAVEVACIRAIRREIEDSQNQFVGGNIQAAVMKGNEGYYLAAEYNNELSFRSAPYGSGRSVSEFPYMHLSWPFDDEIYDPDCGIETLSEKISERRL